MDKSVRAERPDAATGQTRRRLLRRLVDVVAMPGSRVPPQDRSMAGDILLDMLAEAAPREAELCARRLADKSEAPRRLLRFLASREIDIARPLLEDNDGFDVSDLIRIAMAGTLDHRLLIARRRAVDSMLAERLLELQEVAVARALLTNLGAVLSDASLDLLMTLSRDYGDLTRLLMGRKELGPAHALAMFWWSDPSTRRAILQRQAAERADLIANCEDIFPIAAREGWTDPVARKALQLIERRQRNRAAIERSPYDSLEDAIDAAERDGLDPKLAQEIGYLAGVKPVTVAKILSDPGGEGVAVLCKATGLKTPALRALWRAMRRPVEAETGGDHPQFRALEEIYQLLSVAKAQTTLRYWNWSLTAAYSPTAPSSADDANDAGPLGELSVPQRTAKLVFGT